MLNGTVIELQAQMSIVLYPSQNREVEIKCVVDTGFAGFLTLPPALVRQLELPYLGRIDANLADDSVIGTSVHQGIILWDEGPRSILIFAMGRRPLIGTSLLADHHLGIDFCEGGTVIVDEIF